MEPRRLVTDAANRPDRAIARSLQLSTKLALGTVGSRSYVGAADGDDKSARLRICHALALDATGALGLNGLVGKVDRLWSSPRGLLLLSALVALGLFLAFRPLELQSPASGSGRALLRLDNLLGATVEPLDLATAAQLGLSAGGGELVVTSVASDGPAAKAGLRVGDVVERIGSQPAAQARAVASDQSPVPILINRSGDRTMLSIESTHD